MSSSDWIVLAVVVGVVVLVVGLKIWQSVQEERTFEKYRQEHAQKEADKERAEKRKHELGNELFGALTHAKYDYGWVLPLDLSRDTFYSQFEIKVRRWCKKNISGEYENPQDLVDISIVGSELERADGKPIKIHLHPGNRLVELEDTEEGFTIAYWLIVYHVRLNMVPDE